MATADVYRLFHTHTKNRELITCKNYVHTHAYTDKGNPLYRVFMYMPHSKNIKTKSPFACRYTNLYNRMHVCAYMLHAPNCTHVILSEIMCCSAHSTTLLHRHIITFTQRNLILSSVTFVPMCIFFIPYTLHLNKWFFVFFGY